MVRLARIARGAPFAILALFVLLSSSCQRRPVAVARSPVSVRRVVDTRVTFGFPDRVASAELTLEGDSDVVEVDVGVAESRAALDERSTTIERVAGVPPTGAKVALAFTIADVEDRNAHVFRRRLSIELDEATAREERPRVDIDYRFVEQPSHHDGAHKGFAAGRTSTWPYFCGNVFPCQPSPDADATFHLRVTGGGSAIATDLSTPIPPYAAAFAIGGFHREWLGVTHAGTTIDLFRLGTGDEVFRDLASVVPAFAWMETHVGPWSFGANVGPVLAPDTGGMEHVPFWHVGDDRVGDSTVAVHEAIHGWFGNGVRLRCFEDFVLSEGTTEYLTVRVLRELGDPAGDGEWAADLDELDAAMARDDLEKRAWRPETCGVFDVGRHYSVIPYVKGALFYTALERRIGFPRLVVALREFYVAHSLHAASMREMIDALAEAAPEIDVESCATAWLRADTLPSERACADKVATHSSP